MMGLLFMCDPGDPFAAPTHPKAALMPTRKTPPTPYLSKKKLNAYGLIYLFVEHAYHRG
jgi:hypothetical protein